MISGGVRTHVFKIDRHTPPHPRVHFQLFYSELQANQGYVVRFLPKKKKTSWDHCSVSGLLVSVSGSLY